MEDGKVSCKAGTEADGQRPQHRPAGEAVTQQTVAPDLRQGGAPGGVGTLVPRRLLKKLFGQCSSQAIWIEMDEGLK